MTSTNEDRDRLLTAARGGDDVGETSISIEYCDLVFLEVLPSWEPVEPAARRIQHRGCSVSGGRVRG